MSSNQRATSSPRRPALANCAAVLATLGLLPQFVFAQQTPAYQKLDGDVRKLRTLNTAPTELSRFPRSLCIALSADDKRLRTVDANGRIWERPARQAADQKLLAETSCEPACAVLSADGRRLAFADAEGNLVVMDPDTTEVRIRDHEAERTVALAFSPDASLLASVSVGGDVRLWDVISGEVIGQCAVRASAVHAVAFSRDGKRLAIASYGHEVTIYPIDRQKNHLGPIKSQLIRASSRVTAIAFLPEAAGLVIATSDGRVRLHDLAGNGEPREVGRHAFASWSIAFDRNGQRMAAGSWDGAIQLWDAASWELLQTIKKHEESVAAMVFGGESGLISSGLDGRLLAWLPEVPSIGPIGLVAGREDSVWAAVYSPDGKRLFAGGRGNRFELWDVENESLALSRAGQPTTRCADYSANGATLAAGADDGSILLCDAHTGQPRTRLLRHPGAVSAVLFADEGRTLISACDGGVVKVWDAATGREQASWREHRQQIYCAAVSPDAKWLLTGGGNWATGDPGELLVWERKTGRVHARLAGHRLAVWAIVFSPDGKRFFSSDSSGAVKVWHSESLEVERTLQHSTWVRPLAISPDGTTLAVGRGDGSVRLWDTSTWLENASCDANKSFTFWLDFSPDGETLVSGGNDGTVRFWRPRVRLPE